MPKNKQVNSDFVDRREFTYSKGKVSLSFNLRTDIKTELAEFKILLEEAILDVGEVLEDIEKK